MIDPNLWYFKWKTKYESDDRIGIDHDQKIDEQRKSK